MERRRARPPSRRLGGGCPLDVTSQTPEGTQCRCWAVRPLARPRADAAGTVAIWSDGGSRCRSYAVRRLPTLPRGWGAGAGGAVRRAPVVRGRSAVDHALEPVRRLWPRLHRGVLRRGSVVAAVLVGARLPDSRGPRGIPAVRVGADRQEGHVVRELPARRVARRRYGERLAPVHRRRMGLRAGGPRHEASDRRADVGVRCGELLLRLAPVRADQADARHLPVRRARARAVPASGAAEGEEPAGRRRGAPVVHAQHRVADLADARRGRREPVLVGAGALSQLLAIQPL